jgi:type IV pilus assembly protein PilB
MNEEERMSQFGSYLMDSEILSQDQWKKVLDKYRTSTTPIEKILVDFEFINEDEVHQLLEIYYGVPYVKLSQQILDWEALDLISEDLCRHDRIIPIGVEGDSITLAMADPRDLIAQDTVRNLTKKEVRVVYASADDISRAINMYYSKDISIESGLKRIARKGKMVSEENSSGEVTLRQLSEEAPVVKLVNDILRKAIKARASDIHFEPTHSELMVRFRVDGLLRVFMTIPLPLHPAVISRLKVMGGMNIVERRIPQDGRAEVRIREQHIDLRMSTLPTIHGEKLVVRILNKAMALKTIEQLGYSPVNFERLNGLFSTTQGMILVTGPTGCGKTTTCYAMINKLRTIDKNLVSVEDPVEYQLDMVNQVQISHKIGLDFVVALRAILRQDPDVILVGEIRDIETAQMAVHSALTGHIVISTFHTNDAPSAIVRLIDMGVAPFLVVACVSGIVAQRLVRRICPACRESFEPKQSEWESAFGLEFPAPDKIFRGIGCKDCMRTGYTDRVAVAEVMPLSEKIRRVIAQGSSHDAILSVAREEGMITMKEDAMIKVSQGITTVEEVLRLSL